MGMLVQARRVVVAGPLERLEGRQLDPVERRDVAGPVAAVPDIGAGSREERLDPAVPLPFWQRLRLGVETLGQVVDLCHVEHREGAQEGNLAGAVLLVGTGLVIRDGDALEEHDRGAPLPFPDMPAQLARLSKGQPARQRIALRRGGGPERQDIDAGIGPAGGRILRHAAGTS